MRRLRPAFRLIAHLLRQPPHAMRFLAFLLEQRALSRRLGKRLRIIVRNGGLGDVLWAATACGAAQRHHPNAHYVLVTRPQDQDTAHFANPGLPTFGLRIPAPLLYPLARRLGEVIELMYSDERSTPPQNGQHFYLDYLDCLDVPHPAQPEAIRWPQNQPPARSHPKAIYLATEATWAVRQYPREHWRKVIEQLRAVHPHPIIQVIAPSSTEAPLEGCDAHLVHSPLTELCERFSQAALVITVDNFMLHLAWGSGARVVALFGPTSPVYRVFPSPRFTPLHVSLPCQFCHHRHPRLHWESSCPYDIACMNAILPDDIVNAAHLAIA